MDDPPPKPLKMVLKLSVAKPESATPIEPPVVRYRVETDRPQSPAPSNTSSVLTRSEPASELRTASSNDQVVVNKAVPAKAVVEIRSRNVESVKQSLRNAGAEKQKENDKAKEKDKEKERDRDRRPAKNVERYTELEDDDLDLADDLLEDEECLATPKRGRRPFALSRFADPQQLAADLGRLQIDNPTLFCATLCEFLKVLVKMDQFDIFGYPVTDDIAPGYSRIIRTPMDFSTVRRKIIARSYVSLSEFKADVNLICNNAMTYNSATTVFHKEARKLASFTKRVLRAQNFLLVARKIEKRGTTNAILQRTAALCGAEHVPVPLPIRKAPPVAQTSATATATAAKIPADTATLTAHTDPQTGVVKLNALEDDEDVAYLADEMEVKPLNDDELLEMVKRARNRILQTGRLDDRPSASSNAAECVSPKRARMALASGRLQDGAIQFEVRTNGDDDFSAPHNRVFYAPADPRCDTALITSIDRNIEQLRSLAYASTYSYAPTYDSGGDCPLTPEQSAAWNRLVRRVRTTYDGDAENDSVGYEYARSLEWFVRGCVPYAVRYADELLDTLTHGEHSKTMQETNEFLSAYKATVDAALRPPTPPPPTPPPPVVASEQTDSTVDLEAILAETSDTPSGWLSALPAAPPLVSETPATLLTTTTPPAPQLQPEPQTQTAQPNAPPNEQEDEATIASRIMNELEELDMYL